MKRSLVVFISLLTLTSLKGNAQTRILNFNVDSSGIFKREITYTGNKISYLIERNIDDKWLNLYKTGRESIFDSGPGSFVDSIIGPLRKGEDKFRLVITYPVNMTSKELLVYSKSYINPAPTITGSQIYLKENYTPFSINDSNGILIKSDSGKAINISNLKKGNYIITAGSQVFEFEKK